MIWVCVCVCVSFSATADGADPGRGNAAGRRPGRRAALPRHRLATGRPDHLVDRRPPVAHRPAQGDNKNASKTNPTKPNPT